MENKINQTNFSELGICGIPQPEISRRRPLLGEILFDKGIITHEQLDIALKAHRKADEYLGQTIIELGFATEDEVLSVLAEQLGIPYVRVSKVSISKKVISKVPAKFAYYYKLIPTKFQENTLFVALSDPFDIHTLDDLSLLFNCRIKPLLASEKDIIEALKKHYGVGADTVETMLNNSKILDEQQLTKVCDGIYINEPNPSEVEASVTKLVDEIIAQAIKDHATDIHFEPTHHNFRIRYRVDGELFEVSLPKDIKRFQDSIINRIKILSYLDISQKRLPQDGRIILRDNHQPVDLRVSILPTPWGEAVEIRILSHQMDFELDSLGFPEDDFKRINELIHKPHGIILVTGPTGSGKSTTLYSFLNKIKSAQKKIITIEDPIEYEIDEIMQMQVNPATGFDFTSAMRSMLRHDPNILMVGEIRDAESAQIAIRMAITGHLVFSTLHTNDAASSITRLMDMGIEPYLISSATEGIIAQRLVRKICENCKEPVEPSRELIESIKSKFKLGNKIYQGKGCPECRFSGYSGRTAIFEVMILDSQLKQMIANRAPIEQIRLKAQTLGMGSLKESGLEKVRAGLITLEEVLKVTT